MKYIVLIILVMCIWYACSFKDYVEVSPVNVTMIKKEKFIRYPADRIGQYWQCEGMIFLELLPVGDTGRTIGTVEIVFKTQ